MSHDVSSSISINTYSLFDCKCFIANLLYLFDCDFNTCRFHVAISVYIFFFDMFITIVV